MSPTARVPECHPDRPHRGLGLCGKCYHHARYWQDPEVARARSRDWNRAHAGGIREKRLAYDWQRLYGITPADYDQMLDEQGGVCAVCGEPETARHQSGRVRLLAIDHDHATGKVRGLLCHACNTSIGGMADNPVRLMAAAAYVTANL